MFNGAAWRKRSSADPLRLHCIHILWRIRIRDTRYWLSEKAAGCREVKVTSWETPDKRNFQGILAVVSGNDPLFEAH
jgi:hypothetical protein